MGTWSTKLYGNDTTSDVVSKQDEFIKEIKAQSETPEATEWDSFDDGTVW